MGEDFFLIEEGEDYDVVQVRRLCGAAAAEAVGELSVDWDCEQTSCAPPYPCGNYCEALTSDGDRLLSHASGIDLDVGLSPAAAASLRDRVACGGSIALDDSLATLGE